MPDLRGHLGHPETHPAADALIRAWAALAALLPLATPAGACRVELRAEAATTIVEGFAVVRATLAGRAVSLLLDTGAEDMLVTAAAADALGLARDTGRRSRVLGIGGHLVADHAVLPPFRFGALAVPARSVPVVAVTGLPATDPPIAGLIGAPLLGAHELELDLARGRVRLHDARDCPDGVRPFAPPYVMTPLRRGADGQPMLTVMVNGVALRAVLDTGSRATLLTEAAGQRAGLDRAMRSDVTYGVDGAATPVRWHRTRDFRVGWDAYSGVVVGVAAQDLGEADMLLGMDYLATRRVWLSPASGRVFFQQAGAP